MLRSLPTTRQVLPASSIISRNARMIRWTARNSEFPALYSSSPRRGPLHFSASNASPATSTATNASTASQRVVSASTKKKRKSAIVGDAEQHEKAKLAKRERDPGALYYFVTAGLPLVLFSCLAAWAVQNGLEGKTREMEVATGRVSKSERQARMEEEHDDMMEKLQKIRHADFDNTKRIERPEEVLERRRKERERRNVWYRRWWRAARGQS